ncbi:MAG: 3'-5' exonuclease [Myxococcales bacterium]|nr:3'-5' exonuclease [Myxococcales bacterium]
MRGAPVSDDGCGCFPTGRHYAGISHLLKVEIRGLVDGIPADTPWREVPIALIDVETTGRDASIERVVELGVVVGRGGEVIASKNWLVNPGIPIPDEARAVHGISDADVADKPRFEAIVAELLEVLRGAVPAAYNAPFDRAFVTAELGRAKADVSSAPAFAKGVEWIDPLIWARDIQSDAKSRALGDVAARLGVELTNAHRASDDAKAALDVMYRLGNDPRVPATYGAFVQEQRRLSQAQADARRHWRH